MLQNKLHAFVARFTEAVESNGPYYDVTSLYCKPFFQPRDLKGSVRVKYGRKLVGNFSLLVTLVFNFFYRILWLLIQSCQNSRPRS